MIDIRRIRQNPQEMLNTLKARGMEAPVETLLKLDEERRRLLAMAEDKKTQRNLANKQIGMAKKKGASAAELDALTESLRTISSDIAQIDCRINEIDAELSERLLMFPQFIHPDVPCGSSEKENVEISCHGTPRVFPWEPKSSKEISNDLSIVQSERFTVHHGQGARLKRNLIHFLMDFFCSAGYDEFCIDHCALLAENASPAVPVADESAAILYCDAILERPHLPLLRCAHHSIVELLAIAIPDQSDDVLQNMLCSVETAMQLLGLPSRTVLQCSGTLAFCAAKAYAVEVWMPSLNRYVPFCCCSNCEDFHSRRFGIRWRDTPREKPQYVHTLHCNIHPDLLLDSILENMQNEDGTVAIPAALVPLMGTEPIGKRCEKRT